MYTFSECNDEKSWYGTFLLLQSFIFMVCTFEFHFVVICYVESKKEINVIIETTVNKIVEFFFGEI